jgi:hypothetical protein
MKFYGINKTIPDMPFDQKEKRIPPEELRHPEPDTEPVEVCRRVAPTGRTIFPQVLRLPKPVEQFIYKIWNFPRRNHYLFVGFIMLPDGIAIFSLRFTTSLNRRRISPSDLRLTQKERRFSRSI